MTITKPKKVTKIKKKAVIYDLVVLQTGTVFKFFQIFQINFDAEGGMLYSLLLYFFAHEKKLIL